MRKQGGKTGYHREEESPGQEMVPLNERGTGLFELEELERRLEMQRLPLGSSLEAADAVCYTDACDQICDLYCADYTGCIQDCMCHFEDCFDKCNTDCLMLCSSECLADCGFCAGDW